LLELFSLEIIDIACSSNH